MQHFYWVTIALFTVKPNETDKIAKKQTVSFNIFANNMNYYDRDFC